MIKSYPKVNLILKVYPNLKKTKKHKLQSLMVLDRSIYDKIYISKSKNTSVIYYINEQQIIIKDCLISKAIKYLKEKLNIKKEYKITVYKNISLMSGLGGGSSNAGNVILYILKDNKISKSKLNLKDIALNLGSDIPFFLSEATAAIVSEYGNKVKPIKLENKINYNIIQTNIPVSTQKVFQALDLDKNYHSKIDFNLLFNRILNNQVITNNIYNDLQPYIFKVSTKLLKEFNKIKNPNKIVCGSGGSILVLG